MKNKKLICADCGREIDGENGEILGLMIRNKPICIKCAGNHYAYSNGELIFYDDVQSVYFGNGKGVTEIDTESNKSKSK